MSSGAGNITKGALAVLGIAGVLGVGGWVGERVRPAIEDAPVGMTRTQQVKLEQVASASLFGQFRSSMADFLYLKVDKYLHKGVDLRGVTAQEQKTKNADQVTSGDNVAKHNGEETTVVPSQERDWRGVFGNVERQVKPYQSMEGHKHASPTEALPLFRLMTWSNPQFITGYVQGGFMIAHDPKKNAEALEFMREGERNNPHSIEIKAALGEFLTSKLHQYEAGYPYLKDALQIGLSRDFSTLNADEKEAYQNTFRWLVLNRREAGDLEVARRAATVGLRLFPDDIVCLNFLKAQTPPQKKS